MRFPFLCRPFICNVQSRPTGLLKRQRPAQRGFGSACVSATVNSRRVRPGRTVLVGVRPRSDGNVVFFWFFCASRCWRRGTEPRCGRCGYNLTGSQSDRCPECGLRFIEAGVVKGSPASRARLWIGLALLMLLPLFDGLSVATYMAGRAAAERARAQATRVP